MAVSVLVRLGWARPVSDPGGEEAVNAKFLAEADPRFLQPGRKPGAYLSVDHVIHGIAAAEEYGRWDALNSSTTGPTTATGKRVISNMPALPLHRPHDSGRCCFLSLEVVVQPWSP